MVKNSIRIFTTLTPFIGCEKPTEIANSGLAMGYLVNEILLKKGYLPKAALEEILSPENMNRLRNIK